MSSSDRDDLTPAAVSTRAGAALCRVVLRVPLSLIVSARLTLSLISQRVWGRARDTGRLASASHLDRAQVPDFPTEVSDESGRYRMDVDFHRTGVAHDAGAGVLLRRSCPLEERAQHDDDEF